MVQKTPSYGCRLFLHKELVHQTCNVGLEIIPVKRLQANSAVMKVRKNSLTQDINEAIKQWKSKISSKIPVNHEDIRRLRV